MVCKFCGEEFPGKPIRQGGFIFCSIECANMAADIGTDEDDEYFEEEALDLDTVDEEDAY
jgi:hypothetical protein